MAIQDTIKVAIVEDQQTIRDGLCYLLQRTEGCALLDGYASLEDALPGLSQALPDVLLLDIGLPGMDGIEGISVLKARWPELVIVTLTVYDDDDRIFAALCAGAAGYLLKNTTPARLIEGVRDAVTGGAPMSPEIASKVLRLFRELRPPRKADYHLTPHEIRLLKLLVEGHSYKTAAAELRSCVNTVSFHVKNIYRKLAVHSKSEAVAKALCEHLL